MNYRFTASPTFLRALARVVRRTPAPVVRRGLRSLLTSSGLPAFDAERLASQRPSRSIRDRADVDPLRWREPLEGPLASGPLRGAAVVVKESLDVKGLPSSLGDHHPTERAERDAVLVQRIRAAGGRLLGETIMTELGVDGVGVHLLHGTPHNPRAKGYFPGGSSTGTAVAVARGEARFGVGGDGMGSVRIPSAFCGLFGLKPTHGRLPMEGMRADSPTLVVPGPMARTARDCALLWQVLDGQPVRALTPMRPARVGVANQLSPELASGDVRAAFDRALGVLDCPIDRVDVPGAESSSTLGTLWAAYETSRSPWSSHASEPIPQLLMALGRHLSEQDGAWLKQQRVELRAALIETLSSCGGFIVMPTTAIPAPAVDAKLLKGGLNVQLLQAVGCYTPLGNCTGLPAIAIPCGQDRVGRPCSLQVYGLPDSEEDLLRIALSFESV